MHIHKLRSITNIGIPGNAIATVLGSAVACLVSYIGIVKKQNFLSLKGIFSYSLCKNKERTKIIRSKAGDFVLENIFIRIGFLISSVISSYLASSQTAVYSVGIIFRSARKDIIETVLTAKEEESMEPDLIYTEEVLVKPTYAEIEGLPSKLKIINRYRYSEQDTIVLEDYRISYPKIE